MQVLFFVQLKTQANKRIGGSGVAENAYPCVHTDTPLSAHGRTPHKLRHNTWVAQKQSLTLGRKIRFLWVPKLVDHKLFRDENLILHICNMK